MDYLSLQSAVGNFLNRSDLYGDLPLFIQLAEAKLNRKLRIRQMLTNATTTLSSEFDTLPGDFAGPMTMKLSSGEVLSSIAPDAMAERKQYSDTVPGKPLYYSVVGASFEFSPVPDGPYTVYLVYYAQIPPLSSSVLTNWLIAGYPDAYLYGTLSEAAEFLGDPRSAIWTPKFNAIVDEMAESSVEESFGARLTPATSLVV